jgi:hypothetical protein
MLRCNMMPALSQQLGLEDLLADLRHARRSGDLGRLALLSYCEVRRWARDAGNSLLAEHASELITGSPPISQEAFLGHIDDLIHELEDVPPFVPKPSVESAALKFQTEPALGNASRVMQDSAAA